MAMKRIKRIMEQKLVRVEDYLDDPEKIFTLLEATGFVCATL